jgi:UPF0755 protein
VADPPDPDQPDAGAPAADQPGAGAPAADQPDVAPTITDRPPAPHARGAEDEPQGLGDADQGPATEELAAEPGALGSSSAEAAVEPPIPGPVGAQQWAPLEQRAVGHARAGGDARAGRRPRSALARSAGGRPGRRGLGRARAGALLALALAAFAVWFLVSLFQPFAGDGKGAVIVMIPPGSSSSTIGSILARDGVVSSGFFFELRALLDGKRGSLHSGRFQLRKDMSYRAAIAALSKPPPAAIVVKVVIPEGFTRLQIAVLAREDDLTGSYLAASDRSPALNPTHYGAPAGTPDLEGFLFPATYEIDAGAPVARLLDEQLFAFRQRFGPAEIRRARALGVTPYGLLTVASMVEREAQTAGDRPLIAAVIYNRLREGMPLGIDATIYYAVELEKQIPVYAGELTEAQLHVSSPYNTRIHKGLPPTPISNPGLASIDAAAHPAHVPYLYYVAAADGCGEQAFSSTYAGFQANVAAYRAAVRKNGGHPPVCRHK